MSAVKKRILTVLSVLCVLTMFVSCQTDAAKMPGAISSDTTATAAATTIPETTAAPEPLLPGKIILAGADHDTICTVTYPAADGLLEEAAKALVDYVNAAVPNAGLTAAADSETASTEYTIAICAPDSTLASQYTARLDGKQILLCGQTQETVLDAVNYFKAFCITDGYLAIDEKLAFASAAGPEVLAQSPEKYYYYEDIYTPSLTYAYDAETVDPAKSRLVVSGKDVTDQAVWDKGVVTLTDYTVEAGDHIVLLALANQAGDVEVFETTFSCGDGSVMHLYAGEVHAHTSDSDGKETVEKAYQYARDVAKLDFFSVTDHSDSFANSVYQNKHLPNADAFNEPGKFAALYGYEQTYNLKTGYYGHLNTINRTSLSSRSLSLKKYYELMASDEDAVVMFNHPGYTWGNFLEYDLYSPEIDAVLNLSEIKSTSAANYEYALSLTKGWHVSPVYNEDNHSANWGNAYEYCGYVLAPSLTRQNIIDAFNKNRTYTTSDKTLKIYYKINDEWMGSRLDNPDNLHFHVQLSTQKSQGLGIISIIAEDGITVAQKVVGAQKEYTLELDLPPHYDYYYIKVESGNTWCYTAPIWIENREHLTVDEMSQELMINNTSTDDHRVYATVTNHSDAVMTGVTVDFYRAVMTGFTETRTNPTQTVTVGDLAPGASVTVCADIHYNAATPRVYAVAKGTQSGKAYGAVRYMELSNLYFSEIAPFTTRGGADTFDFIELYNNSDSVIDLSKFKVRYYKSAGIKAADLEANTWKLQGEIQPHSTMVIWIAPANNKRTVADFNAHYGTNLVEGKDIVIIKGADLPHLNPVQLELVFNSTVVGRAWYNWGGALEARPNRAVTYNYPTNYTMTAKVVDYNIEPTPGVLTDGQMPKPVTP